MRLKGLHWASRARRDGSKIFYLYAWKNGPLVWTGDHLPAEIPDDHPAAVGFHKAHADAKAKPAHGFVAGLVADFRASPAFAAMADSTRAQWRPWLDRIEDEFGQLELEGMDARGVRKDILDWRDKWRSRPRQADYAMQVLKRLLSFGVDRGELDFNRAAGIRSISVKAERAELIWTEENIKAACNHEETPAAVALAIRLAALTGLRRGDLVELRWDEVGDFEIERATNKSRRRHLARIPILPETRTLLNEIRQSRDDVQTLTVLATESGKPWKVSYLTQQVKAAADRAGVDRHLHDLRGTFATRLAVAGVRDEDIAEILGVSLKTIRMIRRTYVSKRAVAQALVVQLKQRRRPNRLKSAAKPLI